MTHRLRHNVVAQPSALRPLISAFLLLNARADNVRDGSGPSAGVGHNSDTADLAHVLVKKSSKSESGVLVITVLTSPHPTYTDPATGARVVQDFSCEWNCYYCPNEPGQPR